MDLSSKEKITHPLVLAVCMENAKTIERILHKFAPSKERFPRIVPVADPDLQIRPGGGNGHPDPEIGGAGLQKNFFRPFRASFWSKKKGRRRPGPPGPLPWIRHCVRSGIFVFVNFHYAPCTKIL